jgi:hypothetical protein
MVVQGGALWEAVRDLWFACQDWQRDKLLESSNLDDINTSLEWYELQLSQKLAIIKWITERTQIQSNS